MSKRQVILDTETTGLDPLSGHRIIEIGALEMIGRKLTGKQFHCYLNPERLVEEQAVAIHGLNNQFLADKPLFAEIVGEFLTFIAGAELIIHNAPFDVKFIEHELQLAGLTPAKISHHATVQDTLVMARKLHPGQKNNLDALCKRYKVDNGHRTLHGALLDANILSLVYLAMTGGQKSLWAPEPQKTQASSAHDNPLTPTPMQSARPTTIHTASPLELLEHERVLALLRQKKKGPIFWDAMAAETQDSVDT